MGEVEVDGLPVRVKVSAGRVKVEHDDAARVARRARPAATGGGVAGRGGVDPPDPGRPGRRRAG